MYAVQKSQKSYLGGGGNGSIIDLSNTFIVAHVGPSLPIMLLGTVCILPCFELASAFSADAPLLRSRADLLPHLAQGWRYWFWRIH